MKIFLAIPTMGNIRTELCEFIYNNRDDFTQVFSTNLVSPLSRARNTIAEAFLKSNCDVLLTIDSDTIPTVDGILKLIRLIHAGAAIATGVTPIRKGDINFPNVYQNYTDVERTSPQTLPTEPFAIVGCGLSCAMIRRDTFSSLTAPYFKTIEYDNGAFCECDLYFCQQVIDAGMEIVCDPSVTCRHAKTVLLGGSVSAQPSGAGDN